MLKLLNRFKEGLAKSRENLLRKIGDAINRRTRIDDDLLEEIEEILIEADVGVSTSLKIIERIKERLSKEKVNDPQIVQTFLRDEIAYIMTESAKDISFDEKPREPVVSTELQSPFKQTFGKLETDDNRIPYVIMVVGVNGTGKTTTIGKLAFKFKSEGKRVMMAACDTFRAAAIEQLDIWAKRVGSELIRHQNGADPASVAYDALMAARARKIDVLIIDTAGRLHTKTNLMEELKKIKRVLEKQIPGVPQEILLVLDATTGQNAIAQAKYFNEALDITGIVLAKLDGTAKGGVVLAIKEELRLPVKMVGLGEKLEDLKDFDSQEFAEALLG